jgi:hypothetical protein
MLQRRTYGMLFSRDIIAPFLTEFHKSTCSFLMEELQGLKSWRVEMKLDIWIYST